MSRPRIKEIDLYLLLGTIALVVFGLVMLYYTTATGEENFHPLFLRQLFYAFIAIALMLIMTVLSPRVHFTFAYLSYVFCCLLLVGVLIWGDSAKGAARWINAGFFSFQPSEPAKIALILALARLTTDKKYEPNRFLHLLKALTLAIIPLILVLAQPDLGTSIVFAALALFMIIAVGTSYLYLLLLVSPILAALSSISIYTFIAYLILLVMFCWRIRLRLGLFLLLIALNLTISLGAPKLWVQLKPYQKNRLISFVHPEIDPKGSGYQVIQSKVAIGSGGLTGKGLGEGSQTQLKFLPEQHTDFIFSVLGEELGFLGATTVLTLLLLIVVRGYNAAGKSKGSYSSMVCLGISGMVTIHVFINIGMTVGLMPVTGLPLPFLSYGGSFLWTVMAAMGIILGIQCRWKEYTP